MLKGGKRPASCVHTTIALPPASMVTAGATAVAILDTSSSAAPQEFELAVYRLAQMLLVTPTGGNTIDSSAHTAVALPAGSPATLTEEMLNDNQSEICWGVLHVPNALAVAAQTLMVPAGTSCCRHTATGMPDGASAISTPKASESVCSTSTGGSQVPYKD